MGTKNKNGCEKIYIPSLNLEFESTNFGWTNYMCEGKIVMTCVSDVVSWRAKSGLDIKKMAFHKAWHVSSQYAESLRLSLHDGRELEAWVQSERFKDIVFAKPRFGGEDLRMYLGQEGRVPVLNEPLKIGSIVNFKGQTFYVHCPFGRATPLKEDGSFNDRDDNKETISLHPFVKGIISGYAIVTRCDGFKIIKSGNIEHYFSAGECL